VPAGGVPQFYNNASIREYKRRMEISADYAGKYFLLNTHDMKVLFEKSFKGQILYRSPC